MDPADPVLPLAGWPRPERLPGLARPELSPEARCPAGHGRDPPHPRPEGGNIRVHPIGEHQGPVDRGHGRMGLWLRSGKPGSLSAALVDRGRHHWRAQRRGTCRGRRLGISGVARRAGGLGFLEPQLLRLVRSPPARTVAGAVPRRAGDDRALGARWHSGAGSDPDRCARSAATDQRRIQPPGQRDRRRRVDG